VLDNKVLGNKVLYNKVLGNKVLGNKVLDNKVLDNKALDNKALDTVLSGTVEMRMVTRVTSLHATRPRASVGGTGASLNILICAAVTVKFRRYLQDFWGGVGFFCGGLCWDLLFSWSRERCSCRYVGFIRRQVPRKCGLEKGVSGRGRSHVKASSYHPTAWTAS
jgi:hypothetical protein